MIRKVEIYSKNNCAYCDMAMKFFDSKKISYQVYKADNAIVFNEMLERNPNARTVPQIFIDDELIGGYTDLVEYFSKQ
tara:strand:- start:206 stop:439 length:234 start_codon:yes stop_codon:yes gene_type:complete